MIYKNKIEKGLFGWVSKIKDRMYRTITPRGYHIGQAAKEFIKGDTRDMSKFTPLENEVWARYLGTKYEGPSNLEPAIYRPTKGGATYDDVVKLKDESLILSDDVLKLLLDNYKKTGKKSMLVKGNESGLGTYTVSMGEDEKGKYASYYDDWDINFTRGISAKYNIPILNLIGNIVPGTHPFSVYGRRYYKNGGPIRKMQTAAGGPINYKRWDNAKITSYTIPYIKEKAIKLTNAGKATGARLSTNLLDSLADNAYQAGLPIRKGLGIAFKESTFGNPTDDKSAWNLSSKIRELFNNKYPGTYLHINNGHTVLGQHLINYHKGDVNHEVFYEGNPDAHKSIILEAFEFYKQHPDKYNPGLKNYQLLIDKRGDEAMQSPEILKWYDEWEKSKMKIFRPEPYKINTSIQNTALEFVPYNKQGGKMNAIEQFKEGHKIHIKKKNRGKFTAYCGGNVTSACIARAKASGNPTLVKRATFAANARKWKHLKGGKLCLIPRN